MNSDRKEFLQIMRMPPARLDVQETAWYLGFMDHDIPVLVRAGLLKPLVRSPQAVKYFATVELDKLRVSASWLTRASVAISKHWRVKNTRNSTERNEASAFAQTNRSRHPTPSPTHLN